MNFRCGVISQLAVRGGIDGRERAYGPSSIRIGKSPKEPFDHLIHFSNLCL